MMAEKKNPAAMLGCGNRASIVLVVFSRLVQPTRLSPFPQLLFPCADIAGTMLEGVR